APRRVSRCAGTAFARSRRQARSVCSPVALALPCRRCHKLAFASENESRNSRELRQLFKVRERLGQVEGGIIAPFPGKPKWARWPHYLRLRREAMQREREYWSTFGAARLRRLRPKGAMSPASGRG